MPFSISSVAILMLSLLVFQGCAKQRVQPPGYPPSYPPVTSEQPAVSGNASSLPSMPEPSGVASTLYTNARKSLSQGKYRDAEMQMERALRLEPANGWYWHTLGLIHLQQGRSDKARQFLLKADSLAGRDQGLLQANQKVLTGIK